MKRLFALLVLISPAFNNAQSQYYPMVDEAFVWNSTAGTIFTFSSTHYFEGDSVVDGVTYKKFMTILDLAPQNPVIDGLIREDVENEIVYTYQNGAEYQLYDFDVASGDEVATIVLGCETSVTVESVGTIMIAETERDLITMTSGEYWIEGIGSVNSVMAPNFIDCIADWDPVLTCFSNMNNPEWAHPEVGTCTIATSLEEIHSEFSIYPNPTSDDITIVGGQGQQFNLVNSAGKFMFGGTLNGTVVLNTATLSPGIYFIQIVGERTPIRFSKM